MPGASAWVANAQIAPADTKAGCSDNAALGEAAKGKCALVPWSFYGAGVFGSTLDGECAGHAWGSGRHQVTVPLQLIEAATVQLWRVQPTAGPHGGVLGRLVPELIHPDQL